MILDWISKMNEISWTGVIVAVIATFTLGFLWYHWAVFGKHWATALGKSKEEVDNVEGMGGVFAFSVFGGIVKVVSMAILMEGTGTNSISGGLLFGMLISLTFVASSILYHDGFARRPKIVSYINSAHDIVELALIGAIYGAF